MEKNIVLLDTVRTFRRTTPNGVSLHRTGEKLRAGLGVTIGDVCEVEYDHRTQAAYPIVNDGEGEILYLLHEEVGFSIQSNN